MPTSDPRPERVVGRYAIFGEIAAGGMASVHWGRLLGSAGFTRVVAIKRLHRHLASDPEFIKMFLDEARLAARIRHPNVVAARDVVADDDELLIVMEYVDGESLARLFRLARQRSSPIPVEVAVAVAVGALEGLQAAHEARDEAGHPLSIVHRDVSPQNVLVGADGIARVVDFGVAKAARRSAHTALGVLKGKLAYMAPEQLRHDPVDRRTDIYALSVVLWELLAGRRLFTGTEESELAAAIRKGVHTPPSLFRQEVTQRLDEVVLRGCSAEPRERFASARAMADALLAASPHAAAHTVGQFVESCAADSLSERRRQVAVVESFSVDSLDEFSQGDHPSDVGATGARPVPPGPAHPELHQVGRRDPAPASGGATDAAIPQLIKARRVPLAKAEEPGSNVPSSTTQRRSLSAPLVGVIAGTAIALVLGAIVAVVRSTRDPAAGPAAVSAELGQSSAQALVDSASPTHRSAAPASGPSATLPATGTRPPNPAVSHTLGAPSSARPGRARPPTTARPRAKDCDPPWYFDKNNEKRFRRECL